VCSVGAYLIALTYEEREEDVEEEESSEEMEVGLEALANQYGLDKIMETVARMSVSKRPKILYKAQKRLKRDSGDCSRL